MAAYSRFSDALAVRVTAAVGTMATAFLFAALAFVSLPAVIATHDPVVLVGWLSSAFLQLVLLPIVMVGQRQVKSVVADVEGAITAEHAKAHRFRELLRAHHDLPAP